MPNGCFFFILVTTGYLVDTSGYLAVTFGYLIATSGYFWLLCVTSWYFWFLVLVTMVIECFRRATIKMFLGKRGKKVSWLDLGVSKFLFDNFYWNRNS